MLDVAGIAYLNGTCTNFAISINEDRVLEAVSAIILAHEMGHNFEEFTGTTGKILPMR
jgi:hypothetical protein